MNPCKISEDDETGCNISCIGNPGDFCLKDLEKQGKIIDRVTVTGADDRTDFSIMQDLNKEFLFVEFGILVSEKYSYSGVPRFPSEAWLRHLAFETYYDKFNLSCHICGKWVRDLCFEGVTDFIKTIPIDIFKRIQLNFHAIVHKVDRTKFINALKQFPDKQFIFQLDDVNNEILDIAKNEGIDAVPLFDTSGGAGVLPKNWPKANGYCGYAGGLSPYNLDKQMNLITAVAGPGPIWVDAESLLRSENDSKFNMIKVSNFVHTASKYLYKKE